MLSQPVVSPNALKDAINSSPKHLSKGGPMDSIYKSYVFLIQSGFGYYYTWSPFYNPNGDGSRPPDETTSPERASPAPPATARPATTSREIPVPSNKALSSHLGPPETQKQGTKPSKKIHLVRSPFTDLPPVRAMRELALPQSGSGPVSAAEDPIALWLKLGALDKLEQALLDGYWEQLVGKTSRIPQVSRFLRHVPIVQARIEEIHDSVAQGKLDIVRGLIEHKKFAYCRDQQGATPLHKAVLYNRFNIIGYFLEHFPSTLHARDHQGRTPLHYAAVLEDGADIYNALLDNGADENATDVYGHTPTYYLESDELTIDQLRGGVKRSARYRGSHHRNHENRHKHRDSLVKNRSYSAKRAGNRSQVREMIQQGKIEVLEEMVLHGHGDKLLGESSTDPVVQEFLDTVPGYMEQINDVHRAVVRGRLREVQTLISHKSLSLARDVMGFTPLHKAVLYGHFDVVEHLSVNFPQSMGAKDLEGRTPLHLAAGIRDGQKIYDCLIFAGAPANAVDMKGKTPEQYLSHPELLAIEQTVKKNQLANATYLGNTISKLKFLSPNVTKTQTALHDRLLFTSNLLNYERSLADSESSESSPLTPPSPLFEDGNNNFHLSYLRAMVPPTSYRRYSRGRLPPVEIQGEVVTAEKLREWIEDQNVEKLHEAVMSGIADQVAKEHPRDEVIQAYLRHDVPNLMKKFEAIHRALQEGNVPELESQLESQDFALARDHFGMTPLHRAVILNNVASVKFLVNRFPETINARDREGRTALHFAAAIARRTGKNGTFRYLVQNGADARIKDNRSRPAEYYKTHHLPMPSEAALLGSRRKLRSKSEPPMRNGFRSQSMLANQISERITTALQKGSVPLAQELVMEGYGRHLIGRTSWNEELRHYLRQVPTQIVCIENMHRAVENGDLDIVINLSNRDDALLRARDENGYQAIHIAVVNRQPNVVEYIANNYPQYLTAKTLNGRQPLHLAALQKDAEIYRLLVNYGADIRALDARGRTAEYYMRSAGAAKNLATNPGRFYEDHPRRMGAAPLPALGSAFSRKSMPDVNRAGRDTRTRTNSESSVVSDQDDHQTEDDKDDVGDEEIDSGIQSEREKTLNDGHVNALENFARASAQELIEETAREFAEMRRSSAKDSTASTDGSEDREEYEELVPSGHSSNGDNAPRELKSNEETKSSPASAETAKETVEDAAEKSDNSSTEEATENEDSQGRGVTEGFEGENSVLEEDLEIPEEAAEEDRDEKHGVDGDEASFEIEGSQGGIPIDEDDIEPRECLDNSSHDSDDDRPDERSAEENNINVDREVGGCYSEVKEFIQGTLPEQRRGSPEGEKESTRPPLTPQNSIAAEANSADNFERSLSAIPEAASPAPNSELRYDDEAQAEELDNSKNSDPTGSEAGTDDTHHETSKSSGEGSERSARSVQSDEPQDKESAGTAEEDPVDGSELAENQTKGQDPLGATENDGGRAGTASDNLATETIDQKAPDAEEIESEPHEEQSVTGEAKSPEASANPEDEDAKLTNGDGLDQDTPIENEEEPNDPKADDSSEIRNEETKEDSSETPADIPNAHEKTSTEKKSTVQSGETEVGTEIQSEKLAEGPGSEEPQQVDSDVSGLDGAAGEGTEEEVVGNQNIDEEGKTPPEDGDPRSEENGVATSGLANAATGVENTNRDHDTEETDAVGGATGNDDPSGEDSKAQSTGEVKEEELPEPAEITPGALQSDQTKNAADDDRRNAAETEPNGTDVEPSSGAELGARAASEAFIENAALEATKTPMEERATKVRSKSKKRKQAARMKAAMDRLNELIDYWIKEEDLLRLEHVVIAGQGDRLVGKTSPNPQVQEFLSLVPTYMEKIRQVHQAVIKGDVKEVKELLTRKRFALSRDVNGASPLHLSILYGHPEVLKYIVEFFPETLDGPDNEGRTPLHYAAVAPVIDVNFYELLKQAGADINIKDKNGNSADFYRTHPGVLTIEDIFRNYQSSPDEEIAAIETEKPAAIEPRSPQKPPSSMTDVKQEVRETVTNMIRELNMEERGYVEGSGVEAVLVDALIVVCAKRPSTPVSFLGDYLLSVSHATPREVSTPGGNDSSVKTESFKAEVTKVDSMSTAKSTATSVSKSESKPKPEKTVLPVAKKDSREMKTPSTPVRESSPVAPSQITAAPPITVPDAIKVPKAEAAPLEIGASEKPSNITMEKAAQPEQKPPGVVISSASPELQPSSMPSPAKLIPISEGPKSMKESPAPMIPIGPPLVAPMQPLGTAPMSVMSDAGILKQSKPTTIIYKADLFEDDER